MQNLIKIELNKINEIDKFNKFISNLEAQEIGTFGGRKLKLINNEQKGELAFKGELTFNELVLKFYNLSRDENNLKNSKTILEIRAQIHKLNNQSNILLKHSGWFAHLMTKARQFFGPPPLSVSVGIFSLPRSREFLLREIGEKLPDTQEKQQYLAEEIFDELNFHIKEERGGRQSLSLKDIIIDFLKEKNDEKAQALFDGFKDFLKKDDPKRKQEKLIKELVFNYRFIHDLTIKVTLATLLVAAYAYAKEYSTSDFSTSDHPINRDFCVYLPGEEEWLLRNDPSLRRMAEQIYQNWQEHKPNWWQLASFYKNFD